MYPTRTRKRQNLFQLISYTLPKLHTGKNWYIDFKCIDPISGQLKRKKYMLDGIASRAERRIFAGEIIANLTCKLRDGWNPWTQATREREFTPFEKVLNNYYIYIENLLQKGALKKKTFYDYTSRLKMLRDFNASRSHQATRICEFDLTFMGDFLDYIILDREASARTRNNYRTWLSAFCTWLVEKQYIQENPVDKIRQLPETDKLRAAFTKADLARLNQYLSDTNKHFLLACMMEYYTFIRPDELSNIRLTDISIKNQQVFVSSTISKNRRDGMVGLNDTIIRLMIELDTFSNTDDCYLFGKDFKPSPKKADSRIFREYFNKVRAFLHLPDTYQFYSLKDSGIRDLANAAGIVVARDQARHSDISTTNKYLKADALTVHEETKHFKGSL